MKTVYTIAILLLVLPLSSQVTFQPKSLGLEPKGVVYNTEKTVDLRIHPNGWALAYNTGRIVTFEKTRYYQFEIGKHSDPREKMQSKPYNLNLVRGSGSFAYGKINSFFVARAGMGRKTYLSEKAKRKGIAVAYNYQFGPVLGFLKPYYLNVYVDGAESGLPEIQSLRYSEETAEAFLDLQSINGASNFSEGILETRVIPGLQGKFGIHFDAGAYDEFVKAIEIGAMLDIFTQSIPLMAPSEQYANRPYFFNLYVNLHFGRRT